MADAAFHLVSAAGVSFSKNRLVLPRRWMSFSMKLPTFPGSRVRATAAATEPVNSAALQKPKWLDCDLLSTFPAEQLVGKVVMIRCIFYLSPDGRVCNDGFFNSTAATIAYIQRIGARVVIASHWGDARHKPVLDGELVAACLSQHLGKLVMSTKHVAGAEVYRLVSGLANGDILLLGNLWEHKEEIANDVDFAKELVTGIDYLVNDAFPVSHRMLASTVAATRFTSGTLAGLHFEKDLLLTVEITQRRPFLAIFGSGKLQKNLDIIQALVNKCSKLMVTGDMALAFLCTLGNSVCFPELEEGMLERISAVLNLAKDRNVELVIPVDFWCVKRQADFPVKQLFKSNAVPAGWEVVDLGPETMTSARQFLFECRMVLWIDRCDCKTDQSNSAVLLAKLLERVSSGDCTIVTSGKGARAAIKAAGGCNLITDVAHSSAPILEYLKGRMLHGVAAIDPACPSPPQWHNVFADPSLPLVVDIGCGNGLFIWKMAKKWKGLRNFVGLETHFEIVNRCTARSMVLEKQNVFFIEASATTCLRRLITGYPGELAIVAVQCPNPDFNKPSNRWRMVQRQLVVTILDLLCQGGKVFLQSDVESVAVHLRNEFLVHGAGRVAPVEEAEWLEVNPFEVETDWERHVLARGGNMYRSLIRKIA